LRLIGWIEILLPLRTTALTTAGRFLVRRKRPNRPSVDNALASSWCPHLGVQFNLSLVKVVDLKEGAAILGALFACSVS